MRTTSAAPIRMPWRISVYDDGVRVVLSPTAYRDTPTKEFVEFRVVRRWFARAHVLAFGLLLALGAFVGAQNANGDFGGSSPAFGVAFFGSQAAVTLYIVLVGLVNRTTLSVRAGRLSVSHGPLPWTNKHSFDFSSADIAQIFCDQKQEAWGSTYQLKVTLRDASQRTLMDEFETPEQVERLKLAIASRLGLHNAHDRSKPSH